MNKFLLSLLFFTALLIDYTSAQSPNISYQSPQTFYIGKQATPVTVTNTGGAVPQNLYPQAAFFAPGVTLPDARAFVRSSSGDFFFMGTSQIYLVHPDGTSSVFAGTGQYGTIDGTGTSAGFDEMVGITIDASDNIFVASINAYDEANCKIRKVTPAAVVTTVATGLTAPQGITVASNGIIYVSTYSTILKISADGTSSLLAGQAVAGNADGVGANASFGNLLQLVTDPSGNIYANDFGNNRIRKITPGGIVTTLAGSTYGSSDGLGAAASFWEPTDIAIDSKQNLIVADGDGLVRKVSPSGMVTTIAQPPYYDSQNKITSPTYPSTFVIDPNDNIISHGYGSFFKLLTTGFSISPVLPAGLTLGTDGSITGTPTVLSSSQSYTVRAQNSSGVSSTTINLQVVIPPDPPVIDSISPITAPIGGLVTIYGKYFTGTTSVTIGGQPASTYYITSPTSIQANVGDGAASGNVTVTNLNGTASLSGFTLIPPPVISSFTPTSGGTGSVITITGTGFVNVIQVQIGGYYASFKVISPTQIQATVGSGATGDIYIYTANGGANLSGFTYINAPTISSISPASGGAGAIITVNGSNFSNATSVKFGATPASSFTVVSPTQITATVASGSSDGITVTTPGGSTSYSYFSYIPPPVISQVSPLTGGNGTTIYITGSNLSGAQVTIGGVPATVGYSYSSTQIMATVGNGASGDIVVVTPSGTATFPGFVWLPAPVITSFSPQTAALGDKITIIGTNFSGVNGVYIGGVNSVFTILSPTTIEATVGYGASGAITVVSAGGSGSLNGFVDLGPNITSFSPTNAGAGATVTINGTNFTGATSVNFGGVPAASFTVNSSTLVTAVVGSGKSGYVSVASPQGTGFLAGFVHPGPSISYLSPNYAGPLSTLPITINGNNFTGTTSVTFGGVPAVSFTVLSSTYIYATPPNGASGDVVVTTALGSDKMAGFTWVQPPAISSITPASQKSGNIVTITGTNFIGVTGVKFGGVPASYFFANSATTITAYVGAGATGDVTVSTVGGTGTISGFVYASPAIQSISPLAAAAGQTVTITGTNLDSIKTVQFGGINAASFSIVSAGTITAVLGTGASGNVTVTGPSGSGSIGGFKFVSPPVIYGVTPNQGGAGTVVSISGSNLATVTEIKIGGVAATINSVSDNVVTATVGTGATGLVSATTIAGTAQFDGFTWYPPPVITAASPLTAGSQTLVTITGTNFTGVTQVSFGSQIVGFTIVSPTEITALPSFAASGNITVTGPGGSAVLPGFTFIPAPVITAFSVTGEGQNAIVGISGSNFDNASAVLFGGVAAQSFTVISPDSISAVVGSGATGFITVTTPGGPTTFAGFLYKKPPSITSFSPVNGPIGTTVTITGDNFSTTAKNNAVFFGPVKVKVINATQTQLQVIVPAGATGSITVSNIDKALSASSNLPFLITNSSAFTGFSNKFSIQFSSGINSYAVEDFDGDGQPDLLIAKDDSIFMLRHGADPVLSAASFSKKIILETGRGPQSMVVGDLDGDGKMDILYSIERSVVVLHNTSANGNVSFDQTVYEGINSDYNDQMVLRDMDMDGRPDIVMGSGAVYPNTTIGSVISFGPYMFLANTDASSNVSFALADIDGDNKPDPIYGSSYTGFSIFENNSVPGDITDLLFPLKYFLHSGYYYSASAIITADIDGDNKADIVEDDPFANQVFLVSRNIATKGTISASSFAQPVAFSNGSFFDGIEAADVDGDGKIDLIGQTNVSITWARNRSSVGNISFNASSALVTSPSDDYMQLVSAHDMDGDGRPDLIALDEQTHKLTIYNNGPIPVPQITAVTPLTAGAGAMVTITGKYLGATTAVNFGSKAATSFNVVAADTVTAVVGRGESGTVTLVTGDGTATFAGFNFTLLPTLTSAIAATDGSGTLTIKGTNLSIATAVSIAGTPALSFTATSDTSITAVFKGVTGTLSVVNTAGTATVNNVTVRTSQIINFAALPNHTYGDDDFALQATSNNNNIPITFSTDNTGIVSITNGKLHIINAGTVTITASQAGDAVNIAATPVVQVLTINKKLLTLKAVNLSKVYGQPDPGLTVSYSGFAYTDDASKLSVLPMATTTAATTSPAGAYDINVSGAVADNYSFDYIKGTLNVTSAILTVAADKQTKVYGTANPDLTITYSGFVNGDTQASLTTAATVSTTATVSSPVGTYLITASGAADPNYKVNYTQDTLTVTKAALTITADNKTKFYSDDNPLFTVSYAGFVNGDTKASLATQPLVNTTATATSAAGTYPISAMGADASNYEISYVAGILTINPAPAPTITTLSASTGISGSTITLTGTYLLGATNVSFGSATAASFTVNSPTGITAVVGSGATGDVSVTTPDGTGTLGGFNFIPVPTITAGGPTTILSDGPGVVLAANPGSGFAYQWMNNGANINGATSATYTATQGGSYTVNVSLNGLTQSSAAIAVTSVFQLPASNFQLTITSETCNGASDGFINIKAQQALNYTATITGSGLNKSYNFTDTTTISNLVAGTYSICITVAGQSGYENCYNVNITQPQPLSVYATVNNTAKSVDLALNGGTQYLIELNGTLYKTTDNKITLPLRIGANNLKVTTDKLCQGSFEKLINASGTVSVYPVPFRDGINIDIGNTNVKLVTVKVYDTRLGQLVYTKQYVNQSGVLYIDLSNVALGVYGLYVTTDNLESFFKITK